MQRRVEGNYCYLQGVSCEFLGTEITSGSSLGTGIFKMVLHENTRDHSSAFVTAWYGVVLAGVQVSLK